MSYSILFVTFPNYKSAIKISEILLGKKLVACAKLSPVKSAYWWKGKIEKSSEVLMTLTARTNDYSKIEKEIKRMHPYDVPDIISFKVKGSKDYLDWISEVVK